MKKVLALVVLVMSVNAVIQACGCGARPAQRPVVRPTTTSTGR